MKQLISRRINVNKTQKQIAKEIGVSSVQFQKYEYGTVEPKFSIALAWAYALGISIEQFTMYYIKDKEE